MVNFIKEVYHRIFQIKPLTDEDYTAIIIEKIRSGGVRLVVI